MTQSDNSQGIVSVPVLTSSLIGVLLFWSMKQVLEKKNIENTARIINEKFEKNRDFQIKELKDDMKNLQTQIDAKIDIIEQKNVHINLINKEFHNLQKNYNRLKKESIFLKDQLHNAQLDIVEFEQENLNLVNQLNEALQHINSLDQLIESEKSTEMNLQSEQEQEQELEHEHNAKYNHAHESESDDESESANAAETTTIHRSMGENSAVTEFTSFSQLETEAEPVVAAESTKMSISQNLVPRQEFYEPENAKLQPSVSGHSRGLESKTTMEQYIQKDKKLAEQEDDHEDNVSIVSAKESMKHDYSSLNKAVVVKQVPNNDDDMYSFASNIIYDDNIITNANPPSPMKYDLKGRHYKGHSKTESSLSHKTAKSGKSGRSSGSKVIMSKDNGSEIMVQGPTALKRNKSAGKSFSIFNFGKSRSSSVDIYDYKDTQVSSGHGHSQGHAPTTPSSPDDEKFDQFKYKWVSELEYLKNTVENMKEPGHGLVSNVGGNHHASKSTGDLSKKSKVEQQLESLKNDFHEDLNGTLYYDNEEYLEGLNDVSEPVKETKQDDESDVLMVDHRRGVIYSRDYNTSSNLIPKFGKNGFFKRKSVEKRVLSV